MKGHRESTRETVNRFLEQMGTPLQAGQAEGAAERVLNILRLGGRPAVAPSAGVPVFSPRRGWGKFAAAAALVVFGGALQALLFGPISAASIAKASSGELYAASDDRPVYPSERIEKGQRIRAGAAGGAVALRDGSRIEMNSGAELSIQPAADGTTVQLASGTVIVTAARQRNGHLYVETKDCLISVVGTVFTVSAEESGSRVSVIQGEVNVRRGNASQTLLPGEQVTTSLTLGPVPVTSEIVWSQEAEKLAALLPVAPVVQNPAPAETQGVIRGTIIQQGTGEGISGVDVTLCASNGPSPTDKTRVFIKQGLRGGQEQTDVAGPVNRNQTFFFALWGAAVCQSPVSTTTDANGRFELMNVAAGQYTLRASREGYFGTGPETAGDSVLASSPDGGTLRYYFSWSQKGAPSTGNSPASQAVTVDAQRPTAEVQLTLARGAVISGRVLDADGKPIANVPVSAGRTEGPAVGNVTPPLRVLTQRLTDDRGEYRLFGLPEGEYYVVAGPPRPELPYSIGLTFRRNQLGGPEARNQIAGQSPTQTFYPGVSTIGEARLLILRGGDEMAGIDIVVRPAPSTVPVPPR